MEALIARECHQAILEADMETCQVSQIHMDIADRFLSLEFEELRYVPSLRPKSFKRYSSMLLLVTDAVA